MGPTNQVGDFITANTKIPWCGPNWRSSTPFPGFICMHVTLFNTHTHFSPLSLNQNITFHYQRQTKPFTYPDWANIFHFTDHVGFGRPSNLCIIIYKHCTTLHYKLLLFGRGPLMNVAKHCHYDLKASKIYINKSSTSK